MLMLILCPFTLWRSLLTENSNSLIRFSKSTSFREIVFLAKVDIQIISFWYQCKAYDPCMISKEKISSFFCKKTRQFPFKHKLRSIFIFGERILPLPVECDGCGDHIWMSQPMNFSYCFGLVGTWRYRGCFRDFSDGT